MKKIKILISSLTLALVFNSVAFSMEGNKKDKLREEMEKKREEYMKQISDNLYKRDELQKEKRLEKERIEKERIEKTSKKTNTDMFLFTKIKNKFISKFVSEFANESANLEQNNKSSQEDIAPVNPNIRKDAIINMLNNEDIIELFKLIAQNGINRFANLPKIASSKEQKELMNKDIMEGFEKTIRADIEKLKQYISENQNIFLAPQALIPLEHLPFKNEDIFNKILNIFEDYYFKLVRNELEKIKTSMKDKKNKNPQYSQKIDNKIDNLELCKKKNESFWNNLFSSKDYYATPKSIKNIIEKVFSSKNQVNYLKEIFPQNSQIKLNNAMKQILNYLMYIKQETENRENTISEFKQYFENKFKEAMRDYLDEIKDSIKNS